MTTLVHQIRDFVRTRVVPLERLLLDRRGAELASELELLRAEVRAAGWWLPQMPREWGGMGLSLVEFAEIAAELGWSPLGHSVFGCQAPDAGNMEILLKYGTPEQRERWLRPLAEGRIRSSFGLTEPENPGSNPVLLSSRARPLDGGWELDAHKWFTTGFDGCAFVIVGVESEGESASDYGRASLFIVPADAPGVTHVRRISVMGEEGEGNASHSEIRLEGVRVPEDALLGGRGAGFLIAQERLGPGRIHHCMRWIGIAERCLHLLCERAVSRETGRGKKLGNFPAIQDWIADSRAEIDASRLLVQHAARRVEEAGSLGARVEISVIKFHTSDMLVRVMDRALQALGALGMTDDTIVAFFYRHERASKIYDGPNEVHRKVVARQILRSYGLRS